MKPWEEFYSKKVGSRQPSSTSSPLMTQLGRWAWGPCWAADAKGHYAYIGNGPTFQVLDISSDSSKPEIVGEYLTDGFVYCVKVRDNLAYVVVGNGLAILDISNPAFPSKISEVPFVGAWRVEIADSGIAFVTTAPGFFYVVDISNAANPRVRGWTAVDGEWEECLAAKGRYAYVSSHDALYLTVVDAIDPDTLHQRFFDSIYGGTSAFVIDTLLCIGEIGGSLRIYNISNPAFPVNVGQLQLNDWITAITGQDTLLWAETAHSGLFAITIADPAHPQTRGMFLPALTSGVFTSGIGLVGTSLVIPDNSGVIGLNVTKPDSMIESWYFPTGGWTDAISVVGNRAYVASEYAGLWVLDVSNPAKPHGLGNIVTGGWATDVVVSDTLAYLLNYNWFGPLDPFRGLWIIDVSDPLNLRILSHYTGITKGTNNVQYNAIAKSGNLLFMTQLPYGNGPDTTLEIIDVSDPRHPTRAGFLFNGYMPQHIVARDSIAYIAADYAGLRIVDCRTPSSPVELSVFSSSTTYPVVGIAINDSIAYVDRIDTFFVLNASDPGSPRLLGKFGRNYGSFGYIYLDVAENYVYWGWGLLGVIDVSDPYHPIEKGVYAGYDAIFSVAASNDVVFSADQGQGIEVLQNNLQSLPRKFTAATGWNLISLSRSRLDQHKNSVFPSAISPAFAYAGSYVITDPLENGSGYWLKFGSAESLGVYGYPVTKESINVRKGWNLIGTIDTAVSVSAITLVPTGILNSRYYGYEGGYHPTDTLEPGRGYWVKVTQNGTLILSAASPPLTFRSGATGLISFNTLTIIDGAGHSQTLYVGSASGSHQEELDFELPPLPPQGVFDVRFSSGSMAATVADQNSTEFDIEVTSASYPLKITWTPNSDDFLVTLKVGKVSIPLKSGFETAIHDSLSRISLLLVRACELPKEIVLYQNYPNPFNPKTTIVFDNPRNQKITLTIADILGRRIQTLLSEEVDAGRHKIIFDAGNFASGIYFIRIESLEISIVKKIIILK